jgi:hypothetical protein
MYFNYICFFKKKIKNRKLRPFGEFSGFCFAKFVDLQFAGEYGK